ncbi:S41 family peptidase [Azovibrio restrictus]|uniref:S41 family peptidase n=1 Tax=Azovibrio restrictus TaxID=146938 RepID=UPI0026F05554|nr:S41 family peptidase [Azovibrio restrictus]MDD3482243.1 S41 family peptidase [Azovibrio restrictus]
MSKFKSISLVVGGFVAGTLISLQMPAFAEKDVKAGLPVEELRTFAEVFNAIKQGYVEPIEDKKMIANAISGMLSNLDPHSSYLDPESFKELQVGTQGEFGGLGIEVGMEDGLVKVVSPIEDTPAYRAGLKAGDLIFKLDDTPVKGLTLNEAVKRMRGKPKTQIRISILRKGEAKPIEVTLTREVIKVQSVKSKLVEPGYGWVRITQFQENTIPSLAKHLNELYKQGELKGLVLDLRNDPGGLLNGAVGVSAAFLTPGTKVVSTDGRTPDAKQEYIAAPEDYLRGTREDPLKSLPAAVKKVPMVVLVNSGSASASEIVAGALQDHKRAVIMGTQTFGKGSVQTVLPLPGNAAIKLTTARYYTPSGRSIQAKGIEPDIQVEESSNGQKPPAHLREADLEGHLENDRDTAPAKEAASKETAKPQDKKSAPGKKGNEQKGEEELPPRLEYASPSDHQFQQALSLLKGLQIMQNVSK